MLSRHFRFNVTCECNEEEINDDDGVGWMLCPGFEFFACGCCECCWAQHVLYQQRERIRVVNCIARQVLIQFPFHMNLSTLVGLQGDQTIIFLATKHHVEQREFFIGN